MDINIVNAEALVVGPDENLIIKIGDMSWTEDMLGDLLTHFKAVGLADRVLIIQGEEIEFAKVQKSPGIAPDYADSAE